MECAHYFVIFIFMLTYNIILAEVKYLHKQCVRKLDEDKISLEKNYIDNVAKAKKYDFADCIIKDIHSQAFKSRRTSKVNHVTHLFFYSTELNRIPGDTFYDLPNLEQVELVYNHLKKLPSNLFSRNLKMVTVNISRNSISSLPSNVFDGLFSIDQLIMNSCNMEWIPSRLFSQLGNLLIVDLSMNKLTNLPAGLFDNNRKAEYIRLSNNRITSIDCKLLHLNARVYLGYNYLHELSRKVFGEGLKRKNTMLYLEENLFHANCSMSWYLRRGFKISLDVSTGGYFANEPLDGIRYSCVFSRILCLPGHRKRIHQMATDCGEPELPRKKTTVRMTRGQDGVMGTPAQVEEKARRQAVTPNIIDYTVKQKQASTLKAYVSSKTEMAENDVGQSSAIDDFTNYTLGISLLLLIISMSFLAKLKIENSILNKERNKQMSLAGVFERDRDNVMFAKSDTGKKDSLYY